MLITYCFVSQITGALSVLALSPHLGLMSLVVAPVLASAAALGLAAVLVFQTQMPSDGSPITPE
jgi:uncharacterized membrane protein